MSVENTVEDVSRAANAAPRKDESVESAAPQAQERPVATTLLLIRHGETEWNKSGKLAGRTPDVHLNEAGRAQAAGLVQMLARQPIHALYASPLERCQETALPLAAHLGTPVVIEEGLVEVDYGAWHGAELKELAKRDEWRSVQHFPSFFRFPEGETLLDVQYRAAGVAERVAAAHPNQVVALFSHGDVIRTLLAHLTGTPLDLFQRVVISPASVTAVTLIGSRPVIVYVNCTAELPVIEFKPPQEEQAAGAQGEADAAPEQTASTAESHSHGD